MNRIVAVFVVAVLIGTTSYYSSRHLMGARPTGKHTEKANQDKQAVDIIDQFASRLKENPDDTEALLALGDISFDFKVFDKALSYYDRYIKIVPTDREARAKRASTLTFVGRLDEAEKELRAVVAEDPKNFQAQAYLTVALAEKGDVKGATESGQAALALAPSEEVRARFQTFVGSLKEGDPLEMNLRSVPMVGDKLVRIEREKNVIKLILRDFPMEAMPPPAKEKFFGRIRGFLKQGEEAVFVDEGSGKEMERVR